MLAAPRGRGGKAVLGTRRTGTLDVRWDVRWKEARPATHGRTRDASVPMLHSRWIITDTYVVETVAVPY